MMEPWQDLLTHLFKEGRKWVSSLDRNDWRKDIANEKGMITDPSLEIMQADYDFNNWIRTVNDISGLKRKGFVLAPSKQTSKSLLLLVPFVLSGDKNPRLSLQLGFILEHDGNKAFFGYRFESPEVFIKDNENNGHDYYHAQPIRGFGRGDKSDLSIPWYPDGYPAFPLDAKCSIDLIASMLLSSWGKAHLIDLTVSVAIKRHTKTELNKYLNKIKP